MSVTSEAFVDVIRTLGHYGDIHRELIEECIVECGGGMYDTATIGNVISALQWLGLCDTERHPGYSVVKPTEFAGVTNKLNNEQLTLLYRTYNQKVLVGYSERDIAYLSKHGVISGNKSVVAAWRIHMGPLQTFMRELGFDVDGIIEHLSETTDYGARAIKLLNKKKKSGVRRVNPTVARKITAETQSRVNGTKIVQKRKGPRKYGNVVDLGNIETVDTYDRTGDDVVTEDESTSSTVLEELKRRVGSGMIDVSELPTSVIVKMLDD